MYFNTNTAKMNEAFKLLQIVEKVCTNDTIMFMKIWQSHVCILQSCKTFLYLLSLNIKSICVNDFSQITNTFVPYSEIQYIFTIICMYECVLKKFNIVFR